MNEDEREIVKKNLHGAVLVRHSPVYCRLHNKPLTLKRLTEVNRKRIVFQLATDCHELGPRIKHERCLVREVVLLNCRKLRLVSHHTGKLIFLLHDYPKRIVLLQKKKVE